MRVKQLCGSRVHVCEYMYVRMVYPEGLLTRKFVIVL